MSKRDKAVAILIETLFVGLAISVAVLAHWIARWTGLLEPRSSHLAAPLMFGVTMVLSYWIIERSLARSGRPAPALMPAEQREPWPRTLALVLVHVAIATLGVVVIEAVTEALAGPQAQPSIFDRMERADWRGWIELMLVVVIIAPVAEEVVFRGFFFRRLHSVSAWAAWLLPALVFAAQHGELVRLPIYLWIGLVFASAYARTGRLAAAILTHVGYNAIAVGEWAY